HLQFINGSWAAHRRGGRGHRQRLPRSHAPPGGGTPDRQSVLSGLGGPSATGGSVMIRKLKSGEYRLYSRKKNPKTSRRRNLGTFASLEAAQKHERQIQYFKKH